MSRRNRMYWVGAVILAVFIGGGLYAAGIDKPERARWNTDTMIALPHPVPVGGGPVGDCWTLTLKDGSVASCRMLAGDPEVAAWTWDDARWWTDGSLIVYGTNTLEHTPMAADDTTAVAILHAQ